MTLSTFIPKTLSAKVVLSCALFLVAYQFMWGFSPSVISWDTYGYYLYLPQTIIHGDLGIENYEPVANALASAHVESDTFYQAMKAPNTGEWVIKYPIGLALLYLPFFLLATCFAWIGGYPVDGFSLPFQHAMTLGSMFYMLLGLWLLWKILKYFFSDRITAIVILLIVFGTNYYHIHTRSHCMPHVFLFTGYAALIWVTIQWYAKRTLKYAMAIGLVLGLMTICRPTEFIAILIPVFYGVTSLNHFYHRVLGALKWLKHILLAGLMIGILVFPQLLYWKVFAGEWLYNSYQNAGEGLDFLTPYTLDFLFSYRKGWLIYTPIMALAIFGIVRSAKSTPRWWWSATLFSIAYIYVASSWTTWWYAASFSQRTMVQVYPIMAIALAGLLHILWKKQGQRALVLSFGGICLLFNLFQTWQYNNGIIDPERMTKTYYWKVFGKTSIPKDADKYLLVNRSYGPDDQLTDFGSYYLHKTFYLHEWNGQLIGMSLPNPKDSVRLLPAAYSSKFELGFRDFCSRDHCWLVVSGKLKGDSLSMFDNLTVTTTFDHGGIAYKYHHKSVKGLVEWNPEGYFNFHAMYLTPNARSESDPFQFYFLNQSESESFMLSDCKVEVYQRKSLYE